MDDASLTTYPETNDFTHLSEDDRVTLISQLLTSLPRYRLTPIHRQLTNHLRRDIVTSLPSEIAIHCFSYLDLQSLLSCGRVSRRWYELTCDKEIWRQRCAEEGIRANPTTTWKDVFSPPIPLPLSSRWGGKNSPAGVGAGEGSRIEDELEGWVEDDDGGDERRLMQLRFGVTPTRAVRDVHAGVRRDVIEREPGRLDDDPATRERAGGRHNEEDTDDTDIHVDEQVPVDGRSVPEHRRGGSFNTGHGRNQSELPVFILPLASSSSSTPAIEAPFPSFHSLSPILSSASTQPYPLYASQPDSLRSFSSEPSASPKPNYRNLFLTHRILRRRFLRGNPISRVLDGKTSIMNGGLSGHGEGVYCLAIVNQHLVVEVGDSATSSNNNQEDMGSSSSSSVGSRARSGSSPLVNRKGREISGFGQASPSYHASRSLHAKKRSQDFGGIGDSRSPTIVEGRHWVLSGSRDKTIRLWNLETSRVVKVFSNDGTPGGQGHQSSVLTLHVRNVYRRTSTALVRESSTLEYPTDSEAGRGYGEGESKKKKKRLLMVAGGSDGKLVIWDVVTGRIEGEIQAHERGDSVLSVRLDDHRIVSCSKDRSIRVFDLHTLERLMVIGGPLSTVGPAAENHRLSTEIPPPGSQPESGHKAAVNAIDLFGDKIISVSGDRCLCIWSAITGELLLSTEDHSRGIASLALDPLTGDLVTGCSDWTIRLFRLGDMNKTSTGSESKSVNGEAQENLTSSRISSSQLRASTFRPNPQCRNCRAIEIGRRRRSGLDGEMNMPTRRARGGWAAPISEARMNTIDATAMNGINMPPIIPPLDMGRPQPGLDHPFVSDANWLGIPEAVSTSVPEDATHAVLDPGPAAPATWPEGAPGVLCEECEKKGHTDLVRSLWLGKDVVVSGSYDSKVKIWNRHTMSLIANFPSVHAGRLFSVVGDDTKVVSSGIDQKIVIWDFSYGMDTSFI